MKKNSRIFVTGHRGMIGSFLLEELIARGYRDIVKMSSEKLDLRDQKSTLEFFKRTKPEYIFLIAGKVGGIGANINTPANFLYDNIMIAANVIEASKLIGVKKLLFLGSSCIYPRLCEQPMKEDNLLTGSLEPTNEGYAIGKIAGIKLCEYYSKQYGCNYISVISPNVYGPKDHFYSLDSHVISSLLTKIHDAKLKGDEEVEIWGTGMARREFLFNKDLVDGLIFLMNNYNENEPINIGSNHDVSIKELASLIAGIIGYEGLFLWNNSKPDGMPRKLLDISRIRKLGWGPNVKLLKGLELTFNWFLKEHNEKSLN